ncbi:MAG: hypothetical protein WBH75_20200, partial [Thermoanaerobaculia bacterium]
IRHIALGAKEQLMDVISQRSSDNQSSRAGEQIARIPYLRGNEVELLVDGPDTFDNIFAGVDVESVEVDTSIGAHGGDLRMAFAAVRRPG